MTQMQLTALVLGLIALALFNGGMLWLNYQRHCSNRAVAAANQHMAKYNSELVDGIEATAERLAYLVEQQSLPLTTTQIMVLANKYHVVAQDQNLIEFVNEVRGAEPCIRGKT